MTTINGTQGEYRLVLDAWTANIVTNIAERTAMAPAAVVRLLASAANDNLAPPVDAGNMRPGSPGDGRGAGGVAATPAPVSHAAPAHVHLGGGPCVYGERCGS